MLWLVACLLYLPGTRKVNLKDRPDYMLLPLECYIQSGAGSVMIACLLDFSGTCKTYHKDEPDCMCCCPSNATNSQVPAV